MSGLQAVLVLLQAVDLDTNNNNILSRAVQRQTAPNTLEGRVMVPLVVLQALHHSEHYVLLEIGLRKQALVVLVRLFLVKVVLLEVR